MRSRSEVMASEYEQKVEQLRQSLPSKTGVLWSVSAKYSSGMLTGIQIRPIIRPSRQRGVLEGSAPVGDA
jgi:hypothetical protein